MIAGQIPATIDKQLLDCLPYGRAHAVTARTLGEQLGIAERRVRRLVSELRRQGYPVASTSHAPFGFFWPASPEEAHETSRHLWNRVREIASVARDYDRAAHAYGVRNNWYEQLRLVFEGEGRDDDDT